MQMEGLTNFSNDASTSCPDASMYNRVMGTVLFVMVWPFVVFDIKYFPLGRPGAALCGGVFMVVFSIVPQEAVYTSILGKMDNLQTLFLLIGMMLLSYYFDREGVLPYLGLKIFGPKDARRSFYLILWQVCVMCGVLSAFITNDATALILTPIFVNAHIKQKRAKEEILPLLLAIATSCNIGSAATIFGNPQNAFIASAAGVSLLEALIVLLPSAIVGLSINIGLLYGFYVINCYWHKHRCGGSQQSMEMANPVENVERSLTQIGSDLAGSFTSLTLGRRESYVLATSAGLSSSSATSDLNYNQPLSNNVILSEQVEVVTGWKKMKKRLFIAWLFFITITVVVLLAIPACPNNQNITFNLGLVPVAAGVLTMLVDAALNKANANLAIVDIDWSLIALFMGLFVWLNGFERTGLPCELVKALEDQLQITTLTGIMLFTVLVSVGSNVFSNVPLVILIVDQLNTLCSENFVNCELLGGSLLAWVSTIAGNFTIFGSICNLIVAEKSKHCADKSDISNKSDYQLSFMGYLLFGVVSTIAVLFSGLPIVYFTADSVRELNGLSGSSTCE